MYTNPEGTGSNIEKARRALRNQRRRAQREADRALLKSTDPKDASRQQFLRARQEYVARYSAEYRVRYKARRRLSIEDKRRQMEDGHEHEAKGEGNQQT